MADDFDASALTQAMNGFVRVEVLSDRDHNIRLLGHFFTEVNAGRIPSDEAMLYLAGAIGAWLESGEGELAKDHLKVTKPKSHETPSRAWARLRLIADERRTRKTPRRITIVKET